MTRNIDLLDIRISEFMRHRSEVALRLSLAVVFIWFGILKPFGMSPAEPLVKLTVAWMPFFNPDEWLILIGWWEVVIGVTFLFRSTTRIAIGLLALQMLGTFMPLVILPEIAFQQPSMLYALTMEGQYIVKNVLIISSAIVIGGSLRANTARHSMTNLSELPSSAMLSTDSLLTGSAVTALTNSHVSTEATVRE